jgi:GNAT superfamily N-acetyltransferase
MSERIRAAAQADVAAMTGLAASRRKQYARYQPVFWRPAADARDKQHVYFAGLVADSQVITLVSEDDGQLTGFLVATLVSPPPVYDPGGQTCLIDDFTVAREGRWPTTGPALLRAGLAEAARRGAVQALVVTAHLDHRKRHALRSCGLEIASEWWVTSAPGHAC